MMIRFDHQLKCKIKKINQEQPIDNCTPLFSFPSLANTFQFYSTILLFIPRIYLLLMQSLTTCEPHTDPQFQTPEHQTAIQPVSTRQVVSSFIHNYHTLENIQAQDQEDIKLQLLQGNPILPPGKYHLREEPHFRLKFMSMREKFNKTSLQNTGKSLKNLKKEASAKNQTNKYQEEEYSDTEDSEFLTLLQTRKLVYKRLNNSKINCIGKQRILCSVFFDWKKQKITSKHQSIYQHLLRIKRLRCKEPQEDWLTFSSNFQSGNLLMSFRNPTASMPTYQLYMQNDVNTKGCTQWYFFSVVARSRGKAKLRIMNFYKPTSLYQRGMKVLYSYDGNDWKRTGTSISYYKTDKHSYSLDFIHDFEVPDKDTYFSYGYPYTYTENLAHFVGCITSQLKFQKLIHKSLLCTSSMGSQIHILHITNFAQKKEPKQLIYIIGRQHPGETPASFIIQGLINFLLSNSSQAKELRDKYEFRVVPMVNVDGVISGNYRSNVSGLDINRQWQFPSKKGQPQVYYLKQEIGNNRKQTAFFLDIHAHSRKMNSFFYGSKTTSKENKLYPFICSKLNKFISYSDSAFTDDPSKKTTARVILETEFSIPLSLTFQVSFYGWVDPIKQTNYSFKQNDIRLIGESLGIGFYYGMIGIDKAKEIKNSALPKCHSQKEKGMMKNSIKLLQKWNKQIQKQISEEIQQVISEGSSLNPEAFELKEEEKMMIAEMAKSQQPRQNNKFPRNMSTPKETKEQSRKMLIYSTLQPSDIAQESQLLKPKGAIKQIPLGISGNEFYHFSSTAKGQKKQPFSVRQLQLQLQLANNQPTPARKLRGLRLRIGQQNQILSGLERYESLDMQRQKNYKNDVLEMKKALKYLLESKSSDYQQYKSCFKAFNNQLVGLQRYPRSNR